MSSDDYFHGHLVAGDTAGTAGKRNRSAHSDNEEESRDSVQELSDNVSSLSLTGSRAGRRPNRTPPAPVYGPHKPEFYHLSVSTIRNSGAK